MRREEQAGPCSTTMDFLAHNHKKIYAEQYSMHLLLCQVGDAGNLPPAVIAEQLPHEHQFRLTVGVEQMIRVFEKAKAVTDSRDRENLPITRRQCSLSKGFETENFDRLNWVTRYLQRLLVKKSLIL